PAAPRGVRALHADRGLPDHLRRAEDLARRPARRDVRAGGLREARPRRSRADHGGSRAQRPAARPVRALDARHHYGQPRQVVLQGEKVSEIILHRGPLSAEIGLLAVLISWLVGLPVGIISAFRPNSLSDNVARSLSILFLAIPGFWLGMLIVLATLFWFNYKTPLVVVHLWQDPWANLQIIVGPAIVLGLGQGAYIARMARSCLLEVIREDYVRTARAKGLKEALVVMRHALPNALLPVITLSGILMGFVLGGSVAAEQAFGVPGLGRALVVAVI